MKTVTLPLDEFDKMREENKILSRKIYNIETALKRICHVEGVDELLKKYSDTQDADDKFKIRELIRNGQF